MLTDHFDIDAMDMLREVMEDEFPELIQVYLEDSDARLPQLHTAVNDGNAVVVRELAHSFKGASSNISAAPLAKLCYALEMAGKNSDLAQAPELVGQIEQEYSQVRRLLTEMI
ncbi:Hpt domain-containing protein [Thalassolituus sp. LLYu03]|uniref:Hpt domain-containing protein n=1 Tax=Thalassolituus sp. LLYu03 TaxID=3421656 RepID=UPI003D2DE1C8